MRFWIDDVDPFIHGIINNRHIITTQNQRIHKMRSNESGPAGNENVLFE